MNTKNPTPIEDNGVKKRFHNDTKLLIENIKGLRSKNLSKRNITQAQSDLESIYNRYADYENSLKEWYRLWEAQALICYLKGEFENSLRCCNQAITDGGDDATIAHRIQLKLQNSEVVKSNIHYEKINNEEDIANDTLDKVPVFFRWMLFFPAAAVAAVAASTLYILLSTTLDSSELGSGIEKSILRLFSSGVLGAAFVYSGAYVAPRFQFIISLVLLVIVTIYSGILFTLVLQGHTTENILYIGVHLGATLVGAIAAVVSVKEQLEK